MIPNIILLLIINPMSMFEGKYIIHKIFLDIKEPFCLSDFSRHYLENYCVTGMSGCPSDSVFVFEALGFCKEDRKLILGITVYTEYQRSTHFKIKPKISYLGICVTNHYYCAYNTRQAALNVISYSFFLHPAFISMLPFKSTVPISEILPENKSTSLNDYRFPTTVFKFK